MAPTRLDLIGQHAVKRGVRFSLTLDFKQPNGQPVDLTGCSAISQIRRAAADAKFMPWTVTIPTPTNGKITLTLPGSESNSADFPAGRYLWDLVLTTADSNQHVPVSGMIDLEEVISRGS